METTSLDPKTLRMKIAEHDLLIGQVAAMAGVRPQWLSDVLHGRRALQPLERMGLERLVEQLDANPPGRARRGGQ